MQIVNHYAYRGTHGRRNVDAFDGKHTYTLTVWDFEGREQIKLTQRVYRSGCGSNRTVPNRGADTARFKRIVDAMMPLMQEKAQ